MLFSSLIISAVALVASVSAAPQPRALAQVITSCKKPNTVALTFDDGTYLYGYDISKAIVAAGGKATFFLNGNNYGCIYDDANIKRIKYLHDKGHQLASHTWSHGHLNSYSWDKLHDEMWKVEQALQRIAGVQPAFMRPPFGEYNNLVREAAAARGQKVVIWDFDSGDSVGASASESKSRYDQTISQRPASILTLNHETYEQTAHNVIPYAITKLQNAGYQMVTVAECLGEEPYQFTTAPGTKDASWKC
jgi:peptidoglycan/xylan/chitin deacetylase (PgdA/CDA1 family)